MARSLPIIALAALALAGCKDEPSFDERYEAAEEKLEEQAAGIDRDLAKGLADTPRGETTTPPDAAQGTATPRD
ncbi:hypothetical protein [Qipengyuania sp.]|uniref:hypothetical protein n=1 Tax=Qipengyuania sp. TaxID=2004515 RepID=UPI0037355B03